MKKLLVFVLLFGILANTLIAVDDVGISESIVGYYEHHAFKVGENSFVVFDKVNTRIVMDLSGRQGLEATSVTVKVYSTNAGATSLVSSNNLAVGQSMTIPLPSRDALPFPQEAGLLTIRITGLSASPEKLIDFSLSAPSVRQCSGIYQEDLLQRKSFDATHYSFSYSENWPGCAVGESCGNQGLPDNLGVTKGHVFAVLGEVSHISDNCMDNPNFPNKVIEFTCTNGYNPIGRQRDCPAGMTCQNGACALPSTVCGGTWRGFDSDFTQASDLGVQFKFTAGSFQAGDAKCAGGYIPLTMASGTNYFAATNQNDEAMVAHSFNLCINRGMQAFNFWQYTSKMYFVSAFSCQKAGNNFEFKLASKQVSATCSGPSLNQLNTAVNGNTKFQYDSGTGYYLTFSHPDVCSGNSVKEKYCDGGQVKEKTTICPVGALCNNGVCVQQAVECQVTRDCQLNFRVCVNNRCEARGVIACVDNSGCSGTTVCHGDGFCNMLCRDSSNCAQGFFCDQEGYCRANQLQCQISSDCSEYQICQNHQCVEEPANYFCERNSDCGGGFLCGNGNCAKPCVRNTDCDEASYCAQNINPALSHCVEVQPQNNCGYAQNHQWNNYECCDNSACQNGNVCDINVHMCVPQNAVQCQRNSDCDDDEKCDNNQCVVDQNKVSYCQGSEMGVGDTMDVGEYSFLFSTILPGVDCNEAKIKIYKNNVLKDTITECPKDDSYSASIGSDDVALKICKVDNANDNGIFQFSVNGRGFLVNTCEDTDSGMDLYAKGVTTYGVKDLNGAFIDTTTVRDVCVGANSVRKYYCDNLKTAKNTVIQCPNGGVCNDGACSIGKKQINVTFEKGWNLFSVPLNKTTRSVSSCGAMDLWTYDNSLKKYVKVDSMLSGKSYWGYANSKCQIMFEGDGLNLNKLQLKKGWNQIPSSFVQQKLGDLLILCNVVHGPWTYDTLQNTYLLAQNSVPGKGYFVKVGADCKLEG